MMQMSQVLEYAHKTSHPQTRHLAEAITNRPLQAIPRSVCHAGSDVECVEGRCPRREPRTIWQTKPLFDRRLECVDEASRAIRYVKGTIHDSSVGGEASLGMVIAASAGTARAQSSPGG